MEISIIWLIKLVLAHLISDFWWQPGKWVAGKHRHKETSQYLYLHILITGITALLFAGLSYWKVAVVIAVTHGLIDLARCYYKQNFRNFIIGQFLHLLVIALCWVVVFEKYRPNLHAMQAFYENSSFWIFAAGVFFLTLPSSVIIAYITRQWAVPAGLKNAGKYIGIIERVLICLLVYLGQYEAIGLLITGKSILRYNSNNEEVKTEYLLIGTLLSIFMGFSVGMLLKQVVI